MGDQYGSGGGFGKALQGFGGALTNTADYLQKADQLKQQADQAGIQKEGLLLNQAIQRVEFGQKLDPANRLKYFNGVGKQYVDRLFGGPVDPGVIQVLSSKQGTDIANKSLAILPTLLGAAVGDPDIKQQISDLINTDEVRKDPGVLLNNLTQIIDLGSKASQIQKAKQHNSMAAQGFDLRKQEFAQRQKELGVRQTENQSKFEERISHSFETDPAIKKAVAVRDASDQILKLADMSQTNPIAASAIPTFMARASGEVGNLSEADKRPFGGSQAMEQRIKQAFTQFSKGTLTPENQAFIREMANTFRKNSEANRVKRAKEIARSYGKIRPGVSESDILNILGFDQTQQGGTPVSSAQEPQQQASSNSQAPAPHGQRVVQGGVTYEWNGSEYVEAK